MEINGRIWRMNFQVRKREEAILEILRNGDVNEVRVLFNKFYDSDKNTIWVPDLEMKKRIDLVLSEGYPAIGLRAAIREGTFNGDDLQCLSNLALIELCTEHRTTLNLAEIVIIAAASHNKYQSRVFEECFYIFHERFSTNKGFEKSSDLNNALAEIEEAQLRGKLQLTSEYQQLIPKMIEYLQSDQC